MGRNIKQGFEYFPLYTDFFSNKKIKNLRRAHGSIGVLTYLNLLSRVYKNGYYYKFDDLEELSMDIAEEIANVQLRATATSVTETINYLVGRGILDEGLFKRGIISGVALQEQYVIMAYKAKRKIDMDVHCLVDVLQVIEKNRENSEEMPIYSEEMPIYSEFSTQSKSKSKLNKTKDKPNGLSTTTTNNSSLAIARTRECEPSDFEISEYFEANLFDRAGEEALRFKDYNSERGWSCLPDWKKAAKRWIENIKK
jgi:hypothetical protein